MVGEMSVLPALELVQELAEYLALRYPSTFHIERHPESDNNGKRYIMNGWAGAPSVKSVTVVPLGLTYDLNEDEDDMMRVAALLLVFFSYFLGCSADIGTDF